MARRPIWLRPVTESTTGRPAEWSREQITTAAVAVADAEGLAAVTMRRVAAELGTGAASLYRHVETRDDLVDLMVDRAMGDMDPIPDTGDWRADMVTDMMARLDYVRRRPWVLDASVVRQPTGPNTMRLVEQTLARLASCPAAGSAKMEAIGVLNGMLQTTAVNERRGGALDEDEFAVWMTLMASYAGDGEHPHLAAALAEPGPGEAWAPDERLPQILRRVLDGLLPDG